MTTSAELVAARWILDLATPDDLVEYARDAIRDGASAPSIDLLALLQLEERDQANDLFSAALEELGVQCPSRAEAVGLLARRISKQIVSGGKSPHEGAVEIAGLCRMVPEVDFVDLHTFIYADSEWADRPADAGIFAEGVLAAARQLADDC